MGNLMKKLRDGNHIANVSGKDFVLFSGLLELAHEYGVESIESECLGYDAREQTAFFRTVIKGSRGTFTGHGDGMPSNLSKMMLPSFFRMAETRSVCRALRLYLGIGMTARDELPGFGGSDEPEKKVKRKAKKKIQSVTHGQFEEALRVEAEGLRKDLQDERASEELLKRLIGVAGFADITEDALRKKVKNQKDKKLEYLTAAEAGAVLEWLQGKAEEKRVGS